MGVKLASILEETVAGSCGFVSFRVTSGYQTELYYETSHHTMYIVCHLTICHYDYGTAISYL